MHSTSPGLVVITPVFEDAEASARLFAELSAIFGQRVYVVVVDDGSVRQPVELGALTAAGVSGTLIRLRRNVGHQRAIAIGIGYVAENMSVAQVVVMDSDGEDLPESIPLLLKELAAADVDLVVAQRKARVETLRFKAFYFVYKRLFKILTGRQISFGNFMALKPAAIKRLAAMQELWIHVASCVLGSRLRVRTCALDRGPRYAGQSKMNFVGLVLHGFRGVMVFAEDVLVRVGIASAVVAMLALVGGLATVVLKVSGFATPGWFSVALGILALMFLQTGSLALISLMLTGVSKSGVHSHASYAQFIDCVEHTDALSTEEDGR